MPPSKPQATDLDLGLDMGLGSMELSLDSEIEVADDGVSLIGDYTPEDPGLPDDQPVGEYEEETEQELQAVKSQLDIERQKGNDRIKASNDYDYFFCVVFTSMEQRDAFLAATGWKQHGIRHVNGIELSKQMGVSLPESSYRPPKRVGPDPVWSQFAMEDE